MSLHATKHPSLSVTLADLEAAQARIASHARITPVLRHEELDARSGGTVFLKAEVLQRTGAFKFRGAFNKIAGLEAAARARGVVAFSSGNHAQAVAAVAQIFGIPATIVMPSDAPAIKIRGTRHFGADVRLYDRVHESREAISASIVQQSGATLVPPFDDPAIIAGQGTAGLELIAQCDGALDAVLVPASGGGLAAGVAVAVKAKCPHAEIWLCEPEGFDDWGRSLRAGRIERNAQLAGSICDALLAPQPGTITFAINQTLAAGGIAVSDDEVLAAMAFAYRHLKIVVEPGGAVALAAILTGKFDAGKKRVGVVLSGGNVEDAMMARALTEHD